MVASFMFKLYDNAFSPFARKVRMVLDYKGLAHETVDGLAKSNRAALEAVNGRVEVPALDHDGTIVVGSADIVAYLERVFGERSVYPAAHEAWVRARAWERCADTTVDPILVDISYWTWAIREDAMPDGMLAAAQADLNRVYDALHRALDGRDYICGDLSIADIALFPHLTGARRLGVAFDPDRHANVLAWYKRCRGSEPFASDLARTKAYLANLDTIEIERHKIFWRGDRIEWVLARGFHDWFMREITEDRVLWPGLGVPQT